MLLQKEELIVALEAKVETYENKVCTTSYGVSVANSSVGYLFEREDLYYDRG